MLLESEVVAEQRTIFQCFVKCFSAAGIGDFHLYNHIVTIAIDSQDVDSASNALNFWELSFNLDQTKALLDEIEFFGQLIPNSALEESFLRRLQGLLASGWFGHHTSSLSTGSSVASSAMSRGLPVSLCCSWGVRPAMAILKEYSRMGS